MTDNELLLIDRLGVIRDTIAKYGEDNFYISFSGGKDSTVVSKLVDMAVPNNRIPRVFINTGIEYNAIVQFVHEKMEQDDRFIEVKSAKPIKAMLEEVGYPFKSKEHSVLLSDYQKGLRYNKIIQYINGQRGRFSCSKKLLYQFDDNFKLKVSAKCCNELKKKPIKVWQKESKKKITITGMRKEEGGERTTLSCIVTKNGKATKFHPLAVVSDEWEDWFVEKENIKLCELYYPPYNFKRTGCKGCPYSLNLQEQLDVMAQHLPAEKKQCEFIWASVYAEYRRIGYRLRDTEQLSLFDLGDLSDN